MYPCQSVLLYPKPCTPLAANVAFTNLHPPALACWELQGAAATGYRYRNIQDTKLRITADDLEKGGTVAADKR